MKINTRFSLVKYDGYNYILGVANSSYQWYPGCFLIAADNAKSKTLTWRYGNSTIEETSKVLQLDTIYNIEFYYRHLKVDDTEYEAVNGESWSNMNYSLYILTPNIQGSTYNSYFSSSRIYKFEIYDKGNICLRLVPCYCTTKTTNKYGNECPVGTIGMYDLVEGKFYTNKGTGEFLKGNDIN